MKLQLIPVGPSTTLALTAETEAEQHQLRSLSAQLHEARTEARLHNEQTRVTLALTLTALKD